MSGGFARVTPAADEDQNVRPVRQQAEPDDQLRQPAPQHQIQPGGIEHARDDRRAEVPSQSSLRLTSANVNTIVSTTPITARNTPTSNTSGVPTATAVGPEPTALSIARS